MHSERARIHKYLGQLRSAARMPFPRVRERLDCPTCHAVYLILDARGRVAHVGRTTRAKRGLRQRLKAHLGGRSSFVIKYLRNKPAALRKGYTFSFVEVPNPRLRALVEAYATGVLCPRHIGTGESLA